MALSREEEEPIELGGEKEEPTNLNGEEEEDFGVESEPEAPRLPIQYFLVSGQSVVPARHALLYSDGIEFIFADAGATRNWVAPTEEIQRVTIAEETPATIWVAIRMKPKRRNGRSCDQIVFVVSSSDSSAHFQILDFLHYTFRFLVADSVELLEFISMLPVAWRPLLRTWVTNTADERIIADALNVQEPTPDTEKLVVPDLVRRVTVRFSDGFESAISTQNLCRLSKPSGWFGTDIMDAALARFVCEEIPLLPFWNGKIEVMDSMFQQRLLRYESLFDEGVNRLNYERILNALCPKKGKVRKNMVDIRKELIVVPVVLNHHWFLVLIHKPEMAKFDPEIERASIRCRGFCRSTCRIIILDSKIHDPRFADTSAKNHKRLFHLVQGWINLMIFAMDEFPHELGFSRHVCRKIPVQMNNYDCGVFLLMFFQQLITEDWTWMDLPDKDLSKMTVGEQEDYTTRAATYRDELKEAFKTRSTIWADFDAEE